MKTRMNTPKTNKNKQSKNALRQNAQKIINMMDQNGQIPSDVLGSYTGKRPDGETPEQDADDL